MAHLQRGLIKAGVPVLKAELHKCEAFRAVFSFCQPLERLNPAEVGNLGKAISNAEAFASEVVGLLRAGQGAKTEVQTIRAT